MENLKKERSRLQWVPPPNNSFISNMCGRSNVTTVTKYSFYICKNAVEIWLKPPYGKYSAIAFRECPRTNSYKFAECVINWKRGRINKTVDGNRRVEKKIDSNRPYRF